MKTIMSTMAILLTVCGPISAQRAVPEDAPEDCPHKAQAAAASPYAGEQTRGIKALSEKEREQLLIGHGMGLARAAELNSFPGPKHVLELSDSLDLDEKQHETAQRIFDDMHEKATALGEEIVAGEAALDALFAAGTIDQDQLAARVIEIGALKGRLRLSHLEAHLQMRAALYSSQVVAYDRLRSYR